MLVAVVDIPCPSFIGGFDFLSAQLWDEPVPIAVAEIRVERGAVRSGCQAGPRIDGKMRSCRWSLAGDTRRHVDPHLTIQVRP